VDVHLAVEVAGDAELLGPGAHERHRGVGRLLHHVAQLAGEPQRPLARMSVTSMGRISPHLRPGEPGGEADLVALLLLGGAVARHPRYSERLAAVIRIV